MTNGYWEIFDFTELEHTICGFSTAGPLTHFPEVDNCGWPDRPLTPFIIHDTWILGNDCLYRTEPHMICGFSTVGPFTCLPLVDNGGGPDRPLTHSW